MERLSFPAQCAIRGKPGERDVVRGLAGFGAFLANAVLTMDYRRLLGLEFKQKRQFGSDGLQLLIRTRQHPPHLPVAVPVPALFLAHTGEAWAGAIQPLGVEELLALEIAQREVGQVNLIGLPNGRVAEGGLAGGARVDGLPEECQLEAERAASGVLEVPRVVPPFGSEF